MRLKNVYYKLEEKHQAGLPELFAELETEGICRSAVDVKKRPEDVQVAGSPKYMTAMWSSSKAVFSGSTGVGKVIEETLSDMENHKIDLEDGTLLITDDCRLAEQAGAKGIACIGISESDWYFAGAGMVLPDLLDVDVQMVRECFCHFHGIPATIAKSSRLILRELAKEDVEALCRIGEEAGMEYAFCGSRKKAGFTPEVLKAYCKEQYRLYGYGLWGVFLKENVCSQEMDREKRDDQEQARLIGCCGFAEASDVPEQFQRQEPGHCSGLQLELEYMLSNPYQHRGIGSEMCRMALQYASEYLRVDMVWVQVHEKNAAGYALARKLGFRPVDAGRKGSGAGDQIHWFVWKNKCEEQLLVGKL